MVLGINPGKLPPRRNYRTTNRQKWAKLGFVQLGSTVHEKDKDLVLAELEVRRWLRIVDLVDSEHTDPDIIYEISQLNRTTPPDKAERDAIIKEVNMLGPTLKRQVEWCKEEASKAGNKARGASASINAERATNTSALTMSYAKAVSNRNLYTALWKLINVYVNITDPEGTVIGQRDND